MFFINYYFVDAFFRITTIFFTNNLIVFNSSTVCFNPPQIDNGEIVNKKVFVEEDVVQYRCKDKYFAHGENSNKLTTECRKDGTYTLQKEELATCAKRG